MVTGESRMSPSDLKREGRKRIEGKPRKTPNKTTKTKIEVNIRFLRRLGMTEVAATLEGSGGCLQPVPVSAPTTCSTYRLCFTSRALH